MQLLQYDIDFIDLEIRFNVSDFCANDTVISDAKLYTRGVCKLNIFNMWFELEELQFWSKFL